MRFNNSPPICKFFLNSECTNPNCRFLHPLEYPVYIYTTPGIEIHPDELRLAVMSDPSMTVQADNVWLSNFQMFNMEPGEKGFEMLEYPDYFCMPFDMERISQEIEQMKKSRNYVRGGNERSFYNANRQNYRQFDNRQNYRQSDNRQFDSRQGQFDNRQGQFDGRQGQFDGRQDFRRGGNYSQNNTWGSKFNENTQYKSNMRDSASVPYNRGPTGSFSNPGIDRSQYDNRPSYSNNTSNFNNDTSMGFDRKPNTGNQQNDNTEREYEYQNIPYNYK